MTETMLSSSVVGRIMGNQITFVPIPDKILGGDSIEFGLSRGCVRSFFHPIHIPVVTLVIIETELLLLSDGLQDGSDDRERRARGLAVGRSAAHLF